MITRYISVVRLGNTENNITAVALNTYIFYKFFPCSSQAFLPDNVAVEINLNNPHIIATIKTCYLAVVR